MFTIQRAKTRKVDQESTDIKNKVVVKTSVRRLVEFLLRSGHIRSGKSALASRDAMLEGSRIHRMIQRSQGAGYLSEVTLSTQIEEEDYLLLVEGRADGIDRIDGEDGEPLVLIDEIKSTRKKPADLKEPEPLHLAQAMCYAAIYAASHEEKRMAVQVTYCHTETEKIRKFVTEYNASYLLTWFDDLLDKCKMWAGLIVESLAKRDESIGRLTFPFDFRSGQKRLTAMAYWAMGQEKHVFLQAPTGVGKTISMIYPALQEICHGNAEHFYYLTAKTITRTVAEDTLSLLRQQKLFLRSVTITAKEKVCICEEMICDPETCPRANGHYDRINDCLYDMLCHREDYTRACILEYSDRHCVCPYELAFEASVWSDAVICDYNYVFDPHVSRRSLISENASKSSIYLIDEAHNLLDRAREMYSADLCREDFRKPKSIFKNCSKKVFSSIRRCDAALRELSKKEADDEEPAMTVKGVTFYDDIDSVYHPLFRMLERMTDYLTDHEEFDEREEILEFYFKASHFFMILDSLDSGYQIWSEGEKMRFCLRLHCINPSEKLSEYLEACRCSIFFSATLLPIPYYRKLLADEKPEAFSIPSPFPGDHRLIAVTSDVTSRYTMRGEQLYRRIIRYIETTVKKRKGNYMIFFPSYEMLKDVLKLVSDSTLEISADLLVQEPQMGEKGREEFLDCFREDPDRCLIGFCVLGSIFSEGIDLTGNRLSGVLIVGTGLPKVCREREIIRQFFDRSERRGYDYAYRYPGMNKVLQAAGRVIRTPSDRGIILLMDDRFLRKDNQEMFPQDWDKYFPVNEHNWGKVLEEFWGVEPS